MPFKFSNCICLSTPDHQRAVDFYTNVMGLELVQQTPKSVEFRTEQYRLFVDDNDIHGMLEEGLVLEFIVPNLDEARAELEKAGCDVIRWEGKGKDCYVRDPFGGIFNLWEDPEAFDK